MRLPRSRYEARIADRCWGARVKTSLSLLPHVSTSSTPVSPARASFGSSSTRPQLPVVDFASAVSTSLGHVVRNRNNHRQQQLRTQIPQPNNRRRRLPNLADRHQPPHACLQHPCASTYTSVPCRRMVTPAHRLITPLEESTPAMDRCTLSSRGDVSGCPKNIRSAPPSIAIVAMIKRQT